MSTTTPLLYTESTPFRRVCLEISLKPFTDNSPETRRKVISTFFRQWMPLCYQADTVAVMLWASDGSEILEYEGDPSASFEWAYLLGSANPLKHADEKPEEKDKDRDAQGLGLHGHDRDPERKGLHARSYHYIDPVPQRTYEWLRELVSDIKEIGQQLTGCKIEVGHTFDPGPEFARARFKYEWHPEVCSGGVLFGKTFMFCGVILEPDNRKYAGYPQGIPPDTSLGSFLGRQTEIFCRDMGMDFLWLSNGFGFGVETWIFKGALFDGQEFNPEAVQQQRRMILKFWNDFRTECPLLPLRTRGTNLTTGVDLASDGCPIREIYENVQNVEAPVNSPWAALDGDFGLELAGWMSHIAETPPGGYPFRFYSHDPWWMNSPWLDRYQRAPHDIYLPLTVSRLDPNGEIEPPSFFNVLTIDNSLGQLPPQVAAEVCAHIIRGREFTPDRAGPLLWVYPFSEYDQAVFGKTPRLDEVYFGDWYIRGAINQGLPLNTVASTENLACAFTDSRSGVRESIWVLPVGEVNGQARQLVRDYLHTGGKVILYGPVAEEDKELREWCGLKKCSPLADDFDLDLSEEANRFLSGEPLPRKIHHAAIFSAGGLDEQWNPTNHTSQLACAKQRGEYRTLGVTARRPEWQGGGLVWLRGTVSTDETKQDGLLPAPVKEDYFPVEVLARVAASELGYKCRQERPSGRPAILTVGRADNAWSLAVYNPSSSCFGLSFPQGAPLPLGETVRVSDSEAFFSTPRGWLGECRLFVSQSETSKVTVGEVPSVMAGVRRRWLVEGLRNARVTFYPPADCNPTFLIEPIAFPYFIGTYLKPEKNKDGALEVSSINGNLLISW